MADNTVIVYPPNGGAPERHSRANARDLVNGAHYTWMPGVATTPAAIAPFATFSVPDGPALSQRVLDSVGSSGNANASGAANAAQAALAEQQKQMQALAAAQTAAAVAVPAPAPVEVVDFSAAPVVDATDLDDEADAADTDEADEPAAEEEAAPVAEEAPAAPRGRGRPRKA